MSRGRYSAAFWPRWKTHDWKARFATERKRWNSSAAPSARLHGLVAEDHVEHNREDRENGGSRHELQNHDPAFLRFGLRHEGNLRVYCPSLRPPQDAVKRLS